MDETCRVFLSAKLTHDNQSVVDLARQGQPSAIAAVMCATSEERGFWELFHAAIGDHAEANGMSRTRAVLDVIVAECDIWRELFDLDPIGPSDIIN